MNIVDRRLNPGGKSQPNRQRFLRRARAVVQRAVRDGASERSIKDLERGGEVTISTTDVHEPHLRRSPTGGTQSHILPGNKRFVEGDTLPRDGGGQGGGGSSGPGEDGDGSDDFSMVLSREEFLDLFLADLELPDLTKRRLATLEIEGFRRAGYTTTGSPVNLALLRTMRLAMSRRIAMRRPKPGELADLRNEIATAERQPEPGGRLAILREDLARLEQRSRRIPYIDPIDMRFRRLEPISRPVAQAVMFCLMDVSASMSGHMKDLAKRFFMLLYIFLSRRYQHVEVVFIQHTHQAKEVDEKTFFEGRETGGTIVSSALKVMQQVIADRYPAEDWNIYAAQASDGDNATDDNKVCSAMLREEIIPLCQYFAYLEVAAEGGEPVGFISSKSSLWRTYEPLAAEDLLAMRKVSDRREIFPVFRELFRRGGVEAEAATS